MMPCWSWRVPPATQSLCLPANCAVAGLCIRIMVEVVKVVEGVEVVEVVEVEEVTSCPRSSVTLCCCSCWSAP